MRFSGNMSGSRLHTKDGMSISVSTPICGSGLMYGYRGTELQIGKKENMDRRNGVYSMEKEQYEYSHPTI